MKPVLPDFTRDQDEAVANIDNPILEGEKHVWDREDYTKQALEWLFLCELWCSPVLNPNKEH